MNFLSKIKRAFCFILVVALAFTFSISVVNADTIVDNKGETHDVVGKYANDSAEYVVSKVEEQIDLEFGLVYHFDKSYVNTTAAGDITADMNAAGGGAYAASGKMKANTYYPADVRVLEIDPSLGVQVVPWVKFKNANWSLNTVTAMASDYEASHPGYKVIGAINGDFFDINSTSNYNYTSTGSTISEGNNFKVNADWNHIGFKDGTLKGNLRSSVNANQDIEVFDNNGNVIYKGIIDVINADPGDNQNALFVAFWDDGHKAIEQTVTGAYVVEATKLAPYSTTSIYGIGSVSYVAGSTTLAKKNFAIKTTNADLEQALKNGATVRVQNTFSGELAEYDYVVGYPHNVLLDGSCVASADYRHPRTTIGVKADGTIVMAEIDGRHSEINCYGCTLKEEAALMAYYGCVDAFNLDGGGSSTICILEDGVLTIQNNTSDGSARSDGNCLLIVAEVPILTLKAGEVETDSFSVSLNVEKMIETYKDLYIYSDIDGEYRKIEDGGKVTYTGLNNNTKYGYALYAKTGETYSKIPYSGAVNTAKLKYQVTDLQVRYANGGESYQVLYEIDDPQNTLVTCVLVINGKRYYATDGVFKVNGGTISPLSTMAQLQITYNLNDLNGGVTDKINLNAKVTETGIVFCACIDEAQAMINNFFNK